MSNSPDEQENQPKQPKQPKQEERWSFIQNDLLRAIDTWEVLEKTKAGLNPEEEQLVKIKSIINELKEKLEQF